MGIQETITTIEINHTTIMKIGITKMIITYLVVTIDIIIGIIEGRKIFTKSGQHHGREKC